MSTDSASIKTSSEIASVVVLPTGDPSGQAVVLADVRWGEYTALRNKPANAGLRMTYTDGVLEIMSTRGLALQERGIDNPSTREKRVRRKICQRGVARFSV